MSLEFVEYDSSRQGFPTSKSPLEKVVNTKPDCRRPENSSLTEAEPIIENLAPKDSVARKLGASPSSYRIHRKSAPKPKARQEHPKHTIILSYTIECIPKHEIPVLPSISWRSVLETRDQLLMPWKPHDISKDQTIDFFLKRNLEHILSVCSIPVRHTRGEWRPAVALTCGDVDSHRVATGASFHAFQILLLALAHFKSQHLKPQPGDWVCECGKQSTKSYICVMKQRILRVCLGHLKWLLERANKSGKRFCPHYWVDGSKIEGWKQMDFLVGKSLVDTPFHLIKIGGLSSHCILSGAQFTAVRRIASNWIMELERLDKRKVCAFPHYDKKATRSFHLNDHALIWQAIKSVELVGVRPRTMGDYSSKCVRQNILKRFTTQNPVSKRETIAVVRSPLSTEFLLQSKDSAIFSAMQLGLFDKLGAEDIVDRIDSIGSGQNEDDVCHDKIDAWKNTIDCQRHHQGNDDTTWNDPQRFALSIIFGQYLRKAINLRSPQEMLEQAFSTLLSSSSANGLFPGKLDSNHEPTLYDSELTRDIYWENTFEIPYVLWKYCLDLNDGSESAEQPETSVSPSTPLTNDDDLSQSHTTNRITRLLQGLSAEDSGFQKLESPPRLSMKKAFPFNNMTDAKNIVELQDEWLYNLPAFFVPAKKGYEKREDTDTSITASENNSAYAASLSTGTEKPSASQVVVGFKVDFLSNSAKKRGFGDNFVEDIRTHADVARIIARGRTQDVKKRIWVFMSSNPLGNRICTSTVSKTERKEKRAIDAFLKNHESFNNYFWEDTVAELNTWETEFQLSYYTLCSNDLQDRGQRNDVHKREEIVFPSLSGDGNQIQIAKAVVGFRFEGDFFDRYWTYRFMISDPDWKTNFYDDVDDQHITSKDEVTSHSIDNGHRGEVNDDDDEDAVSLSSISYERSDETDASGEDDDEDNEYETLAGISRRPSAEKQRRILELIHSWRMISTMNNAAQAALNVMKEHLEKGKGSMRKSFAATQEYRLEEADVQKLDFKGFLVASRRFQEFQIELQKVEAHFSENLAAIDLWLSREKSRQSERPRWSFNDESRYRAEIQKFVAINDRSIREFRSYHQKISALIEATTKDLEIMHSWLDILRNDLELRRGEDVKRFTYVTVVFLPLGFATGIFSTSGAPAGPTLINMILTAITTLTITVLALVVYKFADSPRSREELMRRWKKGQMEAVETRTGNFQKDPRMKIHRYRWIEVKREQVIELRKFKEVVL
ncbi:hypothetical protein GCG54_00011495 [Colletotrichum gloeosporioides]|uniref:CorA-like Mg2+ transporter n=1 Tax=Colletotrichum gloeosporioides TaxID=474922 RepID=A0A8H4FQC4_COLGL|nr:uncharacterized protein GCG54_00011495 [Colletotrichum gloeosporioides]KAF3809299.1 hypothetical protein GCG54_00011495 [Colletotrichum gloeosporioides]